LTPPTQRGREVPQATATAAKPKRLRRGEASLKIRAALESFANEGKWNVSEEEIFKRAGVSRSTYCYVMKHDDKAKRTKEEYHDQRLGRVPPRHRDL
jgi:hypothetical protein